MTQLKDDRKTYITVYEAMGGWKAVMLYWNPDGFYEPWNTGMIFHPTREHAEVEAKAWAAEEELEFRS